MRLHRWTTLLLIVLCTAPAAVLAQGTTGSLTGTVSAEGTPVPGVTVSISSPSLQGTRTSVTEDTGSYYFGALPPGRYRVSYQLDGMQRTEKAVDVNLAQASRADADLRPSALAESITITAAAPSVLETTEIATNFSAKTIEELPVGRTIDDVVLLSAGVNDAGPNDQIIISGAQSFDNLFLVNGVVVNENLRGQPHKLYVEDAIQETTVLTGAVSAEFGRFTGGVVSTVTKSGGNEFSGSIRDNVSNNSWTEKTPFAAQVEPVDELNDTYEGTLGGRILRDRLWFFGAGRWEDRDTANQTRDLNIPFTDTREDRRWEAKLTAQVTPSHSLVGSYLDSELNRSGFTFRNPIDLASVSPRIEPVTLTALHYNGIFTNNFLVEAQYSEMNHSFANGGNQRDIIYGTLLSDPARDRFAWSPPFCGTACGLKERNNEDILLKGSYFLSTKGLGDHSIVGGAEEFHQYRTENNYQSGSDFRIHGHFLYDTPNARFGFGVDPDNAQIEWDPVQSASQTSDFAVRSFFFNDKWTLNRNFDFNVGVRYDKAFGHDEAGHTTADDQAFSPRLGATFDVKGDGHHRFSATYGRYVAKIESGPANLSSSAGRYSSYYYDYQGPIINPVGTPFNQLIPIEEVIRRVFEWFNANGGTSREPADAFVPGLTTQFRDTLDSPYMDEWTVGYAMALGSRGYVKADYIDRNWDKFYVINRTLETGTTPAPGGGFLDKGFVENSSGNLERKYNGVQLQGSYRLLDRLTFGGNYTWSELTGNVEGETASGATSLTDELNRPEYTGFSQYNPVGALDGDIRHRANLWLMYDIPLGFMDVNLSLLERYHSGLPYSATQTIDVRQSAARLPNGIVNPGYATPPSTVNYYFSERGGLRLDDISSTDLAVNVGVPIAGIRLFVQGELLNALNEDGLEDPSFLNKTVRVRRNSATLPSGRPASAFNPFTTTPVEGVHFEHPANFGTPTLPDAYQQPRTYRFSVGLKF